MRLPVRAGRQRPVSGEVEEVVPIMRGNSLRGAPSAVGRP